MSGYAEYREVNLPWLKAVPAHWEIRRNKNIFTEKFLLKTKSIYMKNILNYNTDFCYFVFITQTHPLSHSILSNLCLKIFQILLTLTSSTSPRTRSEWCVI